MMKVYGPDAKPNDIYIFTAAMVGGILGQPFLDMGYDPANPDADIIHACKKKYKALRNVAKVISLSDDYGASAKKKWQTLRIQGYDFSLAQVKDIQTRLDQAFAGKKQFGKKLQAEHERNGGYILDALGFPTPVAEDKVRDCTNRCIQKSAHEILMLFLYKVMMLLREQKIEYSFCITDFHDETLPIIKLVDVDRVKLVYKEALEWLNMDMLRGTIKLKAEPQFAFSLAEIKVEGYHSDNQELEDLMEDLNEE
jgi:DNA polymerase I-like protein with 3'-5' exonuclease and polymerase domains